MWTIISGFARGWRSRRYLETPGDSNVQSLLLRSVIASLPCIAVYRLQQHQYWAGFHSGDARDQFDSGRRHGAIDGYGDIRQWSHPTYQDVTSQASWSSANTGIAIVGPCTSGVSGCPTGGLAAGVVLAEGSGTTTITATAQGYNGPVSSSVSVTVTSGTGPTGPTGPVSSEGLVSLTILPSSITVGNLQDTGNFIAIGTYTVAPVVRDVTNSAIWLSSFPNVFPVNTNSGGNAGATAGIVTAYGNGTGATIIAEIVDPVTGSIQYATASFSCPYVAPCPCSVANGCSTPILSLPQWSRRRFMLPRLAGIRATVDRDRL